MIKLYFNKIDRIRRDKGFSVEGLCKLIGINRTTLWRWEKGRQIPTEMNVIKLAGILNVSVNDISNMKDIKIIEKQDFVEPVNSWQLLAQMNKKQQKDKFGNVLKELNQLNDNINQAKIIINALTSAMDIIFYIKDSNLDYIIVSNSFLENLKLSSDYNVFGKRDNDFFSEREAKKNHNEDFNILNGKNKTVIKEDFILGTRNKKWGLIKKQPVINSENITVGVIGVFIDITEKKLAEEKRDILMSLLDEVPFMLGFGTTTSIKDKSIHPMYINKTVEKMTGISLDEIYANDAEYLNRKIFDKYYSNHKEINFNSKEIRNILDSGSFYNIYYVSLKNKVRWLKNINTVANYNSKEYAISINMDISEDKEKDLQIQAYQQTIEEMCMDKSSVFWGIKVSEDNKCFFYYLSDNFTNVTGYNKSEFINSIPIDDFQIAVPLNDAPYQNLKQIYEIIHPNYQNIIRKAVKLKKTSKIFKLKIITNENKILFIETTVFKKKVIGIEIIYFGKASLVF